MVEISVVIRTAGRNPIFLRRAVESLGAQSKQPACVIISDDGPALAESALSDLRDRLGAIPLVHVRRDIRTDPERNRAAALNRGVAAASSEWVAFLDDDDTWSPRFIAALQPCIAANASDPSFGGIVTQSMLVREVLRENTISERSRTVMNPELRWFDLPALLVRNQFTINAMVVRRSAFSVVGVYREELPLLEDWEFNVRAAARFRFEVIPEALANYHRRDADGSRDNSSERLMEVAERRIKNEWLRADLAAGRIGLGELSLLGEASGLQLDLRSLRQLKRRVSKLFRNSNEW